MRPQLQTVVGRTALTPIHPAPRPQLGGRRPPRGPHNGRSPIARQSTRSRWVRLLSAAALGTVVAGSAAIAQESKSSLPDLGGTYRCEGDEKACGSSGSTFTVTRSGADLQIKNEKGGVGSAKLTSNISLSAGPTLNMLGVIASPDNHLIQWSNGTHWRKQ